MSADLSLEDKLNAETAPGGVRRVNNRPLIIFAFMVALFVGCIAMVAFSRDQTQKEQEAAAQDPEKRSVGDSQRFAAAAMRGVTAGIIPAYEQPAPVIAPEPAPEVSPEPAAAAPNAPSNVSVPVVRPSSLDHPPMPPSAAINPDMERLNQGRLSAFEEAVKAQTGVARAQAGAAAGGVPRQAGNTAVRQDLARVQMERERIAAIQARDPAAAFAQRMAQLRSNSGAAAMGAAPSATDGSDADMAARAARNVSGQNDLSQFDARAGSDDRYALNAKLTAPRSAFTVTAGASVLPAVLVTGINSELPGTVRGQVSQNVYDTATGRHLLIPQGTQLAGEYSNQVLFGQKGVLVAWQRLIFPDGRTMDIGAMPGTDAAGYAGFRDLVDNHYLRIYSSALLMSGIVAGVAMSQDRGQQTATGQQRASDALSESLGQQLGEVTSQQISKNLNIAPTLEIRPGYRFNVVVTKDLTFSRAYKPFDYSREK